MKIERLPALWRPLGPAATTSLFHGLDDAPRPAADPSAWEREADFIVRHRLGGLALAAASAGPAMPSDVRTRIRRQHTYQVAYSLQLEAQAPAIVEMLDRNGIPSVITKGPGLSRSYPSPALRTFTDLDVIVDPSEYMRAARVLRESGFVDLDPAPPRSYFYVRCREASAFARDNVAIDLHHHIPPWIFGAPLTFASLLAESRSVDLGAGIVRVPSDRHQLVIALLHVFSHLGRPGEEPIVWRDVLTLMSRIGPESAVDAFARTGLGGIARYVLENLPRSTRPRFTPALPATVPDRLARRLVRLMPPHLGARHISGMLYRLPVRNLPGFVWGYAFPSRGFIAAHVDGDRPALRRWWSTGYRDLAAVRDSFVADGPAASLPWYVIGGSGQTKGNRA